MNVTQDTDFKTFEEFYPFYLSQHANLKCRISHFVGISLAILILIYSLATQSYQLLWLLPVAGYLFAWIGHFIFEKNRPATFKYPLFSLRGDFLMYFHILTGKVRIF